MSVLGRTLMLAAIAGSAWPARQLGSEFMPALDQGTLMYMPTTLPGISVTKAAEVLQMQDRIIRSFPEVQSVFGKSGRAQPPTDPAPTEMFETIINLKPKSEWRPGVTSESLKNEMDAALQFPGVSSAWTMPIRARTDMPSTGIRAPVGIKIYGTDLAQMETVAAVLAVVAMALGSEVMTQTVEGRERYGVAVRYPRDQRSDPRAIARDVRVALPGGAGRCRLVPWRRWS